MPSSDATNDFSRRMRDVILPFWASDGFLPQFGLFCEQMNLEGKPNVDVPLRAMVQARQIYIYSHGARTGLMPGAGERALEALHTLLIKFSDDADVSRGLAFSISPTGDIVSEVRDSYAHAFVLLALASVYRLTQDRKIGEIVDVIMAFVDRYLMDRQAGGLFDRYPAPSAAKSQNPLMHMLEAYLALHEAWPDRGFLDRATTIVGLFRERIFQPEPGILLEYYNQDWSAAAVPDPKAFFEPGHQFEWAWLLRWYDTLAGADHSAYADRLWVAACERGVGPGWRCFDMVAFDPAFSKRTLRAWPHTEGVKAAFGRRERGDPSAGRVMAGLLGTINSAFLGRPFPAGWMDRLDANGNPSIDMVPASTLYHLYSAFVETSGAQDGQNRLWRDEPLPDGAGVEGEC